MASPSDASNFSKGYRSWVIFLLILIYALNLADRQGLAASVQAIKLDLKFTDSQLGFIQGLGFALFYTLMGLPLARLAEHKSRTKIISACVGLFGVMVALCSTARGFLGLLALRIGVGVGDAGFGTPVSSLIGDHYTRDNRASVMSVIWLGAPLGVVAGSAGAGYLAQYVSWRAAFLAIGIPAIFVAIVALLTFREPVRGLCDPEPLSSDPPPSTWTVFRFLFAKRSMWHVLIGCALGATSMNAIGQFLSAYLVRNYDMGIAAAGRLLGMIAGVAMASGLVLGGFGVDWAGRYDKRWYVWGPALGLALAAPLFLFAFHETAVEAAVALLVAAHVSMFVYYAPTLALAQNMVGANMRASSAFVVSLVLGLVGIGLGPTIVGVLSDRFAIRAFGRAGFETLCPGGAPAAGSAHALVAACANASATGLRDALMIMSMLCLWAALHYVLAGRNLRRDLDTHYKAAVPAVDAATPAV
jgi:predicted MFS family arabinose efflux permease